MLATIQQSKETQAAETIEGNWGWWNIVTSDLELPSFQIPGRNATCVLVMSEDRFGMVLSFILKAVEYRMSHS